MWDFFKTLSLPKGSDLALWWIGWICVVAIGTKVEGAKDIVLALGGGMVGYLTGRITAQTEKAGQ